MDSLLYILITFRHPYRIVSIQSDTILTMTTRMYCTLEGVVMDISVSGILTEIVEAYLIVFVSFFFWFCYSSFIPASSIRL